MRYTPKDLPLKAKACILDKNKLLYYKGRICLGQTEKIQAQAYLRY